MLSLSLSERALRDIQNNVCEREWQNRSPLDVLIRHVEVQAKRARLHEAHHSRGKEREKKGDLSRSQKDNEIER